MMLLKIAVSVIEIVKKKKTFKKRLGIVLKMPMVLHFRQQKEEMRESI